MVAVSNDALRAQLAQEPGLAGVFKTPLEMAEFAGLPLHRGQHVWLEVPVANLEWVAAYRLVLRDASPAVAEVRVRPNGPEIPPGGVTTRDVLRQVKIAAHIDENWAACSTALLKAYGRDVLYGQRGASTAHPQSLPERKRRGRPITWTDRELTRLAARYLELQPRRPVPRLAEEKDLSEQQTRNLLRQARARGLLTHPPRGMAGGELTRRAKILYGTPDEP
jgi:hypothetical protein